MSIVYIRWNALPFDAADYSVNCAGTRSFTDYTNMVFPSAWREVEIFERKKSPRWNPYTILLIILSVCVFLCWRPPEKIKPNAISILKLDLCRANETRDSEGPWYLYVYEPFIVFLPYWEKNGYELLYEDFFCDDLVNEDHDHYELLSEDLHLFICNFYTVLSWPHVSARVWCTSFPGETFSDLT